MTKKIKISNILLTLVVLLILLFLLAPIIAVVGGSFNSESYFSFPPETWSLKWYKAAFRNKEHLSSLKVSLQLSLTAAALGIVFSLPACIALVRGKSRFISHLKTLFMAPIFVPSIVWAVGLLQFMGIFNISGSFILLVLAHTILTTPYIIRVVGASLEEFNLTLEDAAASLGATRSQTFRYITLPLIRPGVIVGAVFSFMISFSELIITLFISGSRFTTFPVRVYSAMRTEGLDPIVLAYSTVIILVALILSIVGEKFARWSRFF